MISLTVILLVLCGVGLGILIGYYLPYRKKRPAELFLETEIPQLDSLKDIQDQLTRLSERAILGEVALRNGTFSSLGLPHTKVMVAIESHLSMLETILKAHRIIIKKDLSREEVRIPVSERVFRHVFLTLVTNAIQALPDGGVIRVRSVNDQPHWELHVEDNGKGIPKAMLKRVCDPFFTTRGEGTGLGLYVAKRLVEKNHGKLMMTSLQQGGTLVKVTFNVS